MAALRVHLIHIHTIETGLHASRLISGHQTLPEPCKLQVALNGTLATHILYRIEPRAVIRDLRVPRTSNEDLAGPASSWSGEL